MQLQLLKQAYDGVQKPPLLTIDSIMDKGRLSQLVWYNDKPPLVVVNKMGWLQLAQPTLLSFFTSHAFQNNGLGLVWDVHQQRLVEPIVNGPKHIMGFAIIIIVMPTLDEAS
jgi:hypothetical protein